MSSLKSCIKRALDQGEITHDQAQALYDRYDQLAKQILSPPEIRERMAAEVEAEAREKKRRTKLTEMRRIELETQILGHTNRKGELDPGEGLIYLLEHHGQAKVQDVEHKRLAILGQAHAEMEEVLHEFRKGAITGEYRRRSGEAKARLENVVRELFGQNTGDTKAKELAAAWTKVADDLRRRFNAAGGAIGKLQDWGLPQMHSQEALLATTKDEWIAFIEPKLDINRMKNPLTGQAMTPDELRKALEHVYDTIITDGWNTREPAGHSGVGALFRQHADHRFLHFKSADDWLEYQRAFGEGDPFAAMMGHLSTMSRDIAAMEVLGPNPAAMLNHLMGLVQKTNPNNPNVPKTKKRVDDMWAHITGTANMPVGTKLANTAAGARNLISAASLGSATLSAVTDLGFQAAARRFAGLPIVSQMSDFIKQFGTGNTREAVRAGLILDSAVHAMHQQARYVGSISGRTISGYINDRVLTYSGLQAWTQAGKHAFGLAMQAELADHVGKALDQVPDALRRTLERHGFTPEMWDRIRTSSQLYQPQSGATFLRPREIAEGVKAQLLKEGQVDDLEAWRQARALADRYVSMILRETRYAVPESTVAARAGMMSQNQPGTFVGELIRSAGQFKSFGVAVMMLHGGRVAREISGGSKARGALYAGALLITTTLLGALSMQLKEIANGRDPRKMDMSKEGKKFWGAAMLQGGGMGIYGDFLFSDVNRFGGSLAGTVAGPMVDRLDNLRRLTVGNVIEFGEGKEKTNFGRELSQFIKQNTPGSSLWFTRLAYERLLMDQLQYLLDKDAHSAFQKRMALRKRDFGQDFWWKMGETSPRRAPDLGKTFP
jgi:hypothetical protein